MVERIECDRCANIDSLKEFETIKFYDGHWNGTDEKHLCEKCHKEFRKIFKSFMKEVMNK